MFLVMRHSYAPGWLLTLWFVFYVALLLLQGSRPWCMHTS
jgi:hypothetical protein